jgi:hypothetical protein
MPVPAQPKIYHIVHWDCLEHIVADGCIWPDSVMTCQAPRCTKIGMGTIKGRRLGLPVDCQLGTRVGEYVPFYFCPRSIMLFVIHCANHSELAYRGGQQPIVHLEADLQKVVQWADANGHRWAFSLSNAGAIYTQFRAKLDRLDDINWDAVAETDFRQADIKEAKQAEFLVERSFPWHLVERIGVHSQALVATVSDAMLGAAYRPTIEIKPKWYY